MLAIRSEIRNTARIFFKGRLAQLVRASALHAGCRGFESLIAHFSISVSGAIAYGNALYFFLKELKERILLLQNVSVLPPK